MTGRQVSNSLDRVSWEVTVTLRWEPAGKPRGRFVLLHDTMSTATTWWRIGPALADRGWETIAFDLPGHGGTPRLARPLNLMTLVQGVVERLPGRVDVLVGHGLGAVVALAITGRYLDAVRSVVLEEPPGSDDESQISLMNNAFMNMVADSAVVWSDRERLASRERSANPRWAKQDVENAIDGIAAADVPAIVAGLRGLRSWSLTTLVATVRAPVLVLAAPGDLSGTDPGDGSALRGVDRKSIQTLIPDDRFVELDGGHWLHRDQPDQWLDAVTPYADAVVAREFGRYGTPA